MAGERWSHEEPEPFVLGALAIDYGRRRVTVGGEPVALTATEYEFLRVRALDAGRVLTYDTLMRRVWKGSDHANANLVRIFVRSLRRKLGDDAANPAWIFNERSVGCRMAAPGEEQGSAGRGPAHRPRGTALDPEGQHQRTAPRKSNWTGTPASNVYNHRTEALLVCAVPAVCCLSLSVVACSYPNRHRP